MATTDQEPMDAREFEAIMRHLGLDDNVKAAKFCGINQRNMRRRVNQGRKIRPETVMLLRFMVRKGVTTEQMKKIAAKALKIEG